MLLCSKSDFLHVFNNDIMSMIRVPFHKDLRSLESAKHVP